MKTKTTLLLSALLFTVSSAFAQTSPLTATLSSAEGPAVELINPGKTGPGVAKTWRMFNMKEPYGNSFQIWSYDNSEHGASRLILTDEGGVGIGAYPKGNIKLDVNGHIKIHEMQILGGKIDFRPGDNFSYDGKTLGHFSINWNLESNQPEGHLLWQSAWGGIRYFTNGKPRMIIDFHGNVGIGYTDPGAKLDVNGTIRAHEIKVCLNQGCDYVFAEDYNLMNLNDLNNFIKANKHLPEVAPAAQMEADGINVSEMNALLLKKVEELTLHIINMNDVIATLNNRIGELEK